MKKQQFRSILAVAVMIGMFAFVLSAPQTAAAQSGSGSGTLIADGDGLAGIRGNGEVSISGNGILWIRDDAGDAEIEVSGNGHKVELPSGWIRYTGFDGEAEVHGSRITVALSGVNIHLEATGSGKFVLRGSGTYSVESDGETITGVWPDRVEVQRIP
ncbi:MAG: hypothetical protein ACE5E7_13850 [Anaerolineae bacterium]